MSYWLIDRRRRAEDSDIATMAIFGGLSPGMRRFAKFLAVVAAIVVVLYTAYVLILPIAYLRYRLTLDVDVDGVRRTGSGVVEIFFQPPPDSLRPLYGGSAFVGQMQGYAITVDLSDRGLLFVVDAWPMLTNPDAERGLSKTWSLYPEAAKLTMLPSPPMVMAKAACPRR
jgi:hypothetical protein